MFMFDAVPRTPARSTSVAITPSLFCDTNNDEVTPHYGEVYTFGLTEGPPDSSFMSLTDW